jgi:hypothetical protein
MPKLKNSNTTKMKLAVTYLSLRTNFDTSLNAEVAEHGQRRRAAFPSDAQASGAYPVEVRGFKSHPLHQH